MERIIKFRGKSKITKEWIYGDLMTPNYPEQDWHIQKHNEFSPIPVYKETIGQFTGQQDKSGIDIYEKDICKHNSCKTEKYSLFVVKFIEGGFRYTGINNNEWYTLNTGKNFEIIGKTSENPELSAK